MTVIRTGPAVSGADSPEIGSVRRSAAWTGFPWSRIESCMGGMSTRTLPACWEGGYVGGRVLHVHLIVGRGTDGGDAFLQPFQADQGEPAVGPGEALCALLSPLG